MAARIPTAADLGFNDPRAVSGDLRYPANDPVATGMTTLGQGLEKAGTATLHIANVQEDKRQKLNEATADLDFVQRYVDLHTQISKETDADKIAELKKQYALIPQISAQAIDAPERQKLWMAKHGVAIAHGMAAADLHANTLDRERVKVDLQDKIDSTSRTVAATGEPDAVGAGLIAIDDTLKWGQEYGALTPENAYLLKKRATSQTIRGAATTLVDRGRYEDAAGLLDKHEADVDPTVAATLRHRIETAKEKQGAKAVADEMWGGGDKGYAGAPIKQRISDAAGREDISPTLALATASIESNFGQAKDRPGSQYQGVFQLGDAAAASVGGRDVEHGVKFLAKTKSDLADRLGQEPEDWQVYLAHQQGTAGAAALLSNPDKPAAVALAPAYNGSQAKAAQAISNNGGNPNAPASAFVAKWQDRFARAAATVGDGRPTATEPASESGTNLVAFGDSIAAHLVRKAGAGGQESGKVGVYNEGDTAVAGYTPNQVLDVIRKTPDEQINGRNIVLSTGVSNSPAQIEAVAQQIDALKARGAASVTLMGVGTADSLSGVNDKLAQIASANGASFAGPLRKVAGDGIHSSDPKAELAAVKSASVGTPIANGTKQPAAAQQFDGGTPPLPNIDAMTSRVQERADRGEITQGQANVAMADLRARYNHLQSAQANDRAALTKRLSNGAAMLNDGREFDYDPTEIRHFFPKEKADEIIGQLDDARDDGQIVAGIRTASPDQLAEQRAQLAAGLQDPNAPNYAKRRRMVELFDKAADARNKALVGPHADPAGYVAQYSPTVAAQFAAIDPNKPETFANYAQSALAEQERLGVPAEGRSILPAGVAAQTAARVAAIDPTKVNPGAALSDLAKSYGEYWPQVFGDLVKAKLPGTYQVLATMDHPSQGVAASDLSRAIGLIAEKGGMSALKKSVPDDTQKAIDKGLDDALSQFRDSVGYQGGGARLYATVRDAAQALAYYHGFRGKSDSEAVQAAVDGIINNKYDFGRIGGTTVRVPKGELATVERAADTVRAGIKPEDLGPVPGNPLLSPEQRKDIWLGAIRNGSWVNNEDDSGLVLTGLFRDGARSVVRRADGSRIEVKFNNAPALAASAREAATMMPNPFADGPQVVQ